jgi:hypothetical protein
MYIAYKYKQLTTADDVKKVLADLKKMLTYTAESFDADGYFNDIFKSAMTANLSDICDKDFTLNTQKQIIPANPPLAEQIIPANSYIKSLPGWVETDGLTSTDTDIFLSSDNGKNVIISLPTTVTFGTGAQAADKVSAALSIKAYEKMSDGKKNSSYGFADNAFIKPVLYVAGGTLHISVDNTHLLIASVNSNKYGWTPGLGVVDFDPYVLEYDGVKIGSYLQSNQYPKWVYLSMNGATNISTPRTYNIKQASDLVWFDDTTYIGTTTKPSSYPAAKNLFQLKSQYINSVLSPAGMTIPKKTLNYNFTPAIVCARVGIHNKLVKVDNDPDKYDPLYYDIGGDISTSSPIYMIGLGKALDTIDIVLPKQDTIDITDTEDKKSYDDLKYGNYVVWDSASSTKTQLNTSSTFKYIVRLG